MAGKEWQVTQKVTVNGVKHSIPFRMFGEASDVTTLCSKLAGGYEVKEINASLTDLTNADSNVASTNPVTKIGLIGEKNQFASIKPYSGVLHFKNTVSVDDIATALKGTTPFELLPTKKPLKVSVQRNEYFAAEETTPAP